MPGPAVQAWTRPTDPIRSQPPSSGCTVITVSGQMVQIWAGTKSEKAAPILFYWHGTGSSASEATAFMSSQISEITGEGGLVASFTTTTKAGQDTGDAVWYTGDFAMADQILACAVQQLNIDTRQIYTAGCSAGGLQAGAMVFGLWTALGGHGAPGIELAHNVRSPEEVEAVLSQAGQAGGTVVRPAARTGWGGYSGAFADPDGYVWEIAHNPGWTLGPDGSVRI